MTEQNLTSSDIIENDDVQGHMHKSADDTDDVEGHIRKDADDAEGDDTEGHGYRH